ncbi:hypothetical protein BV378_02655 [Nostoc sp. RF31YmG]|nr:hypothetical protein BV378_02655 [Nostoc sp. RF31YmG]
MEAHFGYAWGICHFFAPPLSSYGVHTSLKITPKAWFRRLALGCWIVPEARHCEEERRWRSLPVG